MIVESYQPGAYVFGPGAIELAGKVLRKKGLGRPLIIADDGIKKSGMADRLLGYLPSSAVLFSGFTGEPTLHLAERVTLAAREGNYDSVVGLGGGSSMDLGKMASIMATNEGHVSSYFTNERGHAPLPKVLIPTTAGSGSETSSFAVVKCDDGVKRFVYGPDVVADVALVDPQLTKSCPKGSAAASGMDVLSTGLEAYLSKLATQFSDVYAVDTVQLCHRWLARSILDREDVDALGGMSLAASLSGIAASTPAAVNVGHCIAETLGPMYNIPHGRAVAATLPYMVEYNMEASADRLRELARTLGMGNELELLSWLKVSIKEVGLETGFRQMGVPKEALPVAAKLIFETRQHEYGLPQINPAPITMAGLNELLEKAWNGD